jgi:hypothetical protein
MISLASPIAPTNIRNCHEYAVHIRQIFHVLQEKHKRPTLDLGSSCDSLLPSVCWHPC